ncbi:type II toxin-antitoxin system mRNA interferase toxin, RelE/StbE family [Schleiferilactobacillus harbinensis]|uniref:Type II toxin-antitoxin system mRNA interferase toxin, RelE/StbE family n=2 Tax=Schleiferilactobacillus harbinensis TaxID=304207 RepID=A0ABU7SX15_9LACO
MLTPKDTAHFRRDFKRLKKDGYDMQQLHTVVNLIAEEGHKELLRSRYHDHALSSSSEWRGYRELHITPD